MTAAQPRVAVLALGGTIGSPVRASGGSALTDGAAEIVRDIPEIRRIARVEPSTFRASMSADLRFADLAALAEHIDELADDGVDGVVVTQGTDTLEESAYLLDLLGGDRIPTVVTGAMRNPGLPGADGPANLLDAVRVAASGAARGTGVLVVLDQRIHAARWARKTHTSGLGAFSSEPLGPLGFVSEGRVRLPLRRGARVLPAFDLSAGAAMPRVGLIRLSLDDDPSILEALIDLDHHGFVVEAYGAGHVGRRSLDALTALADSVPVVFASRTGAGELNRETGGYAGSETDLLSRGLIGAGSLDGLKARVLLTVLLASGTTGQQGISRAFSLA